MKDLLINPIPNILERAIKLGISTELIEKPVTIISCVPIISESTALLFAYQRCGFKVIAVQNSSCLVDDAVHRKWSESGTSVYAKQFSSNHDLKRLVKEALIQVADSVFIAVDTTGFLLAQIVPALREHSSRCLAGIVLTPQGTRMAQQLACKKQLPAITYALAPEQLVSFVGTGRFEAVSLIRDLAATKPNLHHSVILGFSDKYFEYKSALIESGIYCLLVEHRPTQLFDGFRAERHVLSDFPLLKDESLLLVADPFYSPLALQYAITAEVPLTILDFGSKNSDLAESLLASWLLREKRDSYIVFTKYNRYINYIWGSLHNHSSAQMHAMVREYRDSIAILLTSHIISEYNTSNKRQPPQLYLAPQSILASLAGLINAATKETRQ